jgi:two-component system chemotaxis response regulator CheY
MRAEMQYCEILIVEDEISIRDTLKMFLEMENFSVCTASNGREGINLLKSGKRPSLIILDLMMPVMNGWEFMEALNDNVSFSNIPVIVTTAYPEKAKEIAVKKVFVKPIDLEALLEAIGECIERRANAV